jgi:hypothetical protein
MDRTEILIKLNNAAHKEFAYADAKKHNEREVEKHTYCGRTLMKLLDGMLDSKSEISTHMENLLTEGTPT